MDTSNRTSVQLSLLVNDIAISLTQEQVTVISFEDADLAQFKWCAAFDSSYGNGGSFLAMRGLRTQGKRRTEYLHRVILARMLGRELTRQEEVDHKDRNSLNNRRDNLRLATKAQNQHNKGSQCNNSSGYKGVGWHKLGRRWQAQIMVNGKNKYLGLFDTPEEAHAAYCEAAKKHHGEFARLD